MSYLSLPPSPPQTSACVQQVLNKRLLNEYTTESDLVFHCVASDGTIPRDLGTP